MGQQLVRQPLELRQLFRPGALLDALRQRAARLQGRSGSGGGGGGGGGGTALDELRLATAFDPRRLPAGAAAAALSGLMLQGARLDGERMAAVAQVRAGVGRLWGAILRFCHDSGSKCCLALLAAAPFCTPGGRSPGTPHSMKSYHRPSCILAAT
jgi:hypothetical protein